MTRWITILAILILPAVQASSTDTTRTPHLDEMMPLLSDLASRGGYGVADTERAAFIIAEDDGELRCVLWPYSAEFQRATWEGIVPENVVAIAHTHPLCCREVSAHDRREAERLGVPVIAVSMGTVSLVDANGRRGGRAPRISWSRHSDPDRRCAEAAAGE